MIDDITYEYRGRLSIVEALNMNIGDLVILRKFILERRAAADERKAKEENNSKNNAMRHKLMNAAYRGHPQAGITGTDADPNRFQHLTRDDYAKLEDDFNDMI